MGFAANQSSSLINPANEGNFPTFAQLDAAPTYASQFSGGKTYGLTFNVGGQEYSYVPNNIANNGGLTAGDNTYLLPYFTDQKNVDNFNQNSKNLDLTGTSLDGYLKSQGLSTNGYLVPYNKVVYDSYVNPVPTSTLQGDLVGLKKEDGNIVYGLSGGSGARYSTTTGEVHDPKVTYSSSILDNILSGNIGGALQGIADHAGDFAAIAAGYYGGAALSEALGPALSEAMGGASLADLPPVPPTLPSFGEGVQVASTDPNAGLASLIPPTTSASVLPAVTPAVTDTTLAGLSPEVLANITAPEIVVPAVAGGTALSTLGTTAAPVASTVAPVTSTVAPSVASSGTGLVAPTTASLGGAEGLTSGNTQNLSTMGGAQGLTGALPTTGTTVGATGGGLSAGGLGTGIGASLAGSALGNGIGGAGTSALSGALGSSLGSLTGSTLGDMALIQGGTGLLQSILGSNAAQSGANAQSAAAQAGIDLQKQIFNTINQQQAPYRTAGYNALNQLGGLGSGAYQMYDAAGNPTTMGTGTGYLTKQFGPADLQAGLAPNYDFMLQQGQMANQRAANVGGGGLGGNALQGLQNYTQNYAGNAYQNAFNNYQSQRTGIYNTLAGIAGIGQSGQTAANTAATNMANANTGLGVGSAAAQAAGQVGSATAYGNALGNLGSGLTLATLLNQRGNATLPVA
jgi:hypothetical protein